MKRKIFLISLILASSFVKAQFGSQQEINSSIDEPNDAKCYDLDGDGDLDILVSSQDDNKISWYENNGEGNFGVQQVIITTAFSANIALSDDLDGDGDLDVFSMSSVLDKISWHENDGIGNFGLEQVITTEVAGLSSMYTADLDGDGDPDLVSASLSDDEIAWYENDGDGNFGPQQIISDEANNARSVFASDLNGDGYIDVLYISWSDSKIAWFENDGTGVFGAEQIIVTDLTGVTGLVTSDLDDDGDQDVISGSSSDNKIIWFENDGTGIFGVEQIVTSTFLGLSKVIAADLDNDLDFDILSCSSFEDKVSWFENDGDGDFGIEQIITTLTDAAISAAAGDLDGDGFQDVISVSILDEKVAWYKNDGTGVFGPQRLVVTDHDGANNVYAGDMDGDGDSDVISTAFFDGKLVWYNNDGEGNFISQNIIAENVEDVRSAFPADLDDDGDLDVLSASSGDNKIAWYENVDGLGNFGPQQVISTSVDDAQSVYAADLNGDGYLDVLSASENDDKLAWYENDGTGTFGVQQIISLDAEEPNTVYCADLDGDGDQDVLSASDAEFDDLIAWFENDGDGNFGELQAIYSETFGTGANDVSAADLDGDGDLDVLSSSNVTEAFWDDKIAWYENDGDGGFGPQQEITDDIDGANSVFAADLDGDGDQDVLSTALNDSEVVWYENDGDGGFGPKQVIWDEIGANDVYAIDLNGDGGVDVLSSGSVNGRIAWYENLACLDYATIEMEGEDDEFICLGSDVVHLLSDKEGGIFSGTAVTIDEFDPVEAGVGVHIIYYTRTIDEEGCAYTDSISVVVLDLPEVSITEMERDTFCLELTPIVLEGLPEGGVFSGAGIIETDFTPSTAGPGIHEVIYTYEDEFACASSDTVFLTVLDFELPEVSFIPLLEDELCISEESVSLEGLPIGGIFEGDGVTGTVFDPVEAGEGMHVLYYTYEDVEGCINSDSIQITIWDLPSVTFNDLGDNTLCSTESALGLIATPVGGVFSGTGVLESEFSPISAGEGEYTLYYEYEDINGCSSIDSIELSVVDCLSLEEDENNPFLVYPNPFKDHTTLDFGDIIPEKGYTVRINNILGQEVYLNENVIGSSLTIEKGELGVGVFVLSLYNSDFEELFSTKLFVE